MVGLIIHNHDIFHAHEVSHDPLNHLSLGFLGGQRLAPALEKRSGSSGNIRLFPKFERMEVGYEDLCLAQIIKHVTRHKFPACIIRVRIIGLQYSESVLYCQSGGNNQKAPCEFLGSASAYCINGLPCDQHRHDSGFAGTCCQFQSEAHEFRIGFPVGVFKMGEKAPVLRRFRSHLSKPYHRFHSFHLTEKRANTVEFMMTPVFKQARGFRRYFPIFGIRYGSPQINITADHIDQRGWIIYLLLC